MNLTRRQWIGSGLAAAALLAVAGLAYELQPDPAPHDAYRFRVLDETDRAILAAIVPVMIPGAPVLDVIRGFDTAVAGLPPSVQDEIAQLFMLLRFAPTRMLAAGVMHPWHEATPGEIARFLNDWRFSRFAKLRSAYDALHALTLAAWYGNAASWARIGYPGPPKVR